MTSLPMSPNSPNTEHLEPILKVVRERVGAELSTYYKNDSELFMAIATSHDTFLKLLEILFNAELSNQSIVLPRVDRQWLFSALHKDLLAVEPLGKLLADDLVTSIILANNKGRVSADYPSNLDAAEIVFRDENAFAETIENLSMLPLKLVAHRNEFYVRSRMLNGWTLEVISPPVSPHGRLIAITRLGRKTPLSQDDLVRFGCVRKEFLEFLRGAMVAGIRILVTGHARSGKTMLLNVLSGFVPNDERIISVETFAELMLRQEHVVTLETRDHFEPVMTQISSFRPDRIFMDEPDDHHIPWLIDCGLKSPTYSTLRAWDARTALKRIELALLYAFPDISVAYARDLIHRSFDLIVTIRRLPDGSRKVIEVVEVTTDKTGSPEAQLLFEYQQTGIEGGKIIGRILPTGTIPQCLSRIEAAEIPLPENLFDPDRFY